MRFLLILYFIVMPTYIFSDVKDPVNPKGPKVIENNQKNINKENEKNKSNSEKKKNPKNYSVNIVFENKTELNGIIKLSAQSINIVHKKKGFTFRKKLKWVEIKKLKILRWKPGKYIRKKTGLHLCYFYPNKWEIETYNNERYIYSGKISFLNKLELKSDYGTTNIFSYFIDYWRVKAKNTGSWLNLKSRKFNYPENHPNERVIRIINFKRSFY